MRVPVAIFPHDSERRLPTWNQNCVAWQPVTATSSTYPQWQNHFPKTGAPRQHNCPSRPRWMRAKIAKNDIGARLTDYGILANDVQASRYTRGDQKEESALMTVGLSVTNGMNRLTVVTKQEKKPMSSESSLCALSWRPSRHHPSWFFCRCCENKQKKTVTEYIESDGSCKRATKARQLRKICYGAGAVYRKQQHYITQQKTCAVDRYTDEGDSRNSFPCQMLVVRRKQLVTEVITAVLRWQPQLCWNWNLLLQTACSPTQVHSVTCLVKRMHEQHVLERCLRVANRIERPAPLLSTPPPPCVSHLTHLATYLNP